ncbi:hypothetical protein RHMOL_Rhmol06G0198500 [Rhododendron molle]|uniref:Uncharacterized protein n=1 Tax=Rhododendron molle TaxID=49168 RepID=A0ACC0NFC1_RHOML|nr:hypothetical protein RHMOL_Rhmol06G0198500 [Rhododendron molle]
MESHQRAMMGFVLVLVCFLGSSQAYTFLVGGKEGWALKPSEGYSHWAQRNRFQVNDTLIFKYNKGSDSVLIVEKNDYYNCNKAKPIQSLSGGDSVYKIDRSGPIFFISGEADNCNKGQKLEIIVLAVRNNSTTHKAPSPTASALSPSPAANPAAASPNVVESPKAESPSIETSPEHSSVVQAPAPAPSAAASVGGGSVGLVMGLSLVLGFVSGLV